MMNWRAVCTRLPAKKSFDFRCETAFSASYSLPLRMKIAFELPISARSQSILVCSASGRRRPAATAPKRRSAASPSGVRRRYSDFGLWTLDSDGISPSCLNSTAPRCRRAPR